MKNLSLVFFAVLALSMTSFSQKNLKDISFSLKLFTGNVSVGGDLQIDDGSPKLNCPDKIPSEQSLFQNTGAVQTVLVDVNNSSGNSCVSLIITTSSGVQKIIVPITSNTGVLRFDKVKSIILRVEKYSNITGTNNTLESNGLASVWF